MEQREGDSGKEGPHPRLTIHGVPGQFSGRTDRFDQWPVRAEMCYNASRRDPAFQARLWRAWILRVPGEEHLPDEQF